MATGQIVAIIILVTALYLLATVILPFVLIAAFNLLIIYLAGKQAYWRWQSNTHHWYEVGAICSLLITAFYHVAVPFWPVTTFLLLAVLIAESIQWVERTL